MGAGISKTPAGSTFTLPPRRKIGKLDELPNGLNIGLFRVLRFSFPGPPRSLKAQGSNSPAAYPKGLLCTFKFVRRGNSFVGEFYKERQGRPGPSREEGRGTV